MEEKFILYGFNFTYCRMFIPFFIILKKNYMDKKGGLVNSGPPGPILGCTQIGFPQKLKNNLLFLRLCVRMN